MRICAYKWKVEVGKIIKFVRTKRMAPILEHEGKCTIFLKYKFQKEHNRKEWQK